MTRPANVRADHDQLAVDRDQRTDDVSLTGRVRPPTYEDSRFGAHAVARLRAAFARSAHPMLLADDRRRWVTANAAACQLFGMAQEEVPWHTVDEFTPPSNRGSLRQQWQAFLTNGAAEGWVEFEVPGRGLVPVEFSAIANILPARHLAVSVPPGDTAVERAQIVAALGAGWAPTVMGASGRLQLTEREREVMALVAAGGRGGDMAERLLLSPETVKSHVQNAMGKLGAHTRAHAVAIALITGQIGWPDDQMASDDGGFARGADVA